MKKTALVTGASSGIGKEISRVLAEKGFDLVLVSQNSTRLASAKQEIESKFQVDVDMFPVDLSDPDAPNEVFQYCQGKDNDVLVNNAGGNVYGPFQLTDLTHQQRTFG